MYIFEKKKNHCMFMQLLN